MTDPADVYAVPDAERRDDDSHPDDNALAGGADDDLDDVYANPGDVIEGDLT